MTTPFEAVELFLASLRTRSAPKNTIKSYRHDLSHFAQAMPGDFSLVSTSTIQGFLDSEEHLSPATRARRYSTLCAFYHWLMRQEIVQDNPMKRLDPIVQPRKEPRPLKPDEVEKILKAIPATNTRDRALFTLLYETGIRVGDYVG